LYKVRIRKTVRTFANVTTKMKIEEVMMKMNINKWNENRRIWIKKRKTKFEKEENHVRRIEIQQKIDLYREKMSIEKEKCDLLRNMIQLRSSIFD